MYLLCSSFKFHKLLFDILMTFFWRSPSVLGSSTNFGRSPFWVCINFKIHLQFLGQLVVSGMCQLSSVGSIVSF